MKERVGAPPRARQARADATRELLLHTAERLYAERGIAEVSNRQVAEAAGQANNSAVAYHVGTRGDLVAAIALAHAEDIAARMAREVTAARGSSSTRDHVACLVRPFIEHLDVLGTPSWFARFTAQTTADPNLGLRPLGGPALEPLLAQAFAAMQTTLPVVPEAVITLRQQMVRLMVVHMCAEQERAAALARSSVNWELVGETLVDAATAVVSAPPP